MLFDHFTVAIYVLHDVSDELVDDNQIGMICVQSHVVLQEWKECGDSCNMKALIFAAAEELPKYHVIRFVNNIYTYTEFVLEYLNKIKINMIQQEVQCLSFT